MQRAFVIVICLLGVVITSVAPGTEKTINEHLYTRGFLLASENPAYIPEQYKRVDNSLWVDKSQLVTFSDNDQCCIIGFCVDIRSPEANVLAIANNLDRALSVSETEFHREGDFLCGRYVIVYKTNDGVRHVVTDAAGFLPVFHDEKGRIVASHARLIAVNIKSRASRGNRVQYYDENDPTRSTQYKGVFQLNPNKSLEFGSGQMVRFFPYEKRKSLSKQEMVTHLTDMIRMAIKGLVQNQSKPILLSLTAGSDSRTTLSIMLCARIKPELTFTYVKPGNGSAHDNEEAEQLCRKLGLQHVCIDSTKHPIRRKIKDALRNNCQFCFEDLPDQIVSNMTRHFPKDRYVHVCSHVTEVWRWFNAQADRNDGRAPGFVKKAVGIDLDREALFDWPLSSMVYWENRLSRWLTDSWICTDVVFDTFCPYNCRKIISVMLSVPSDFQDTQEVHDLLIEGLYHDPLET